MRQPALVLDPELPFAVDRRLTENHRRQAVNARVIADVLVPGSLGAAVGGMEIQRPGLRNTLRQFRQGVAGRPLDDLGFLHPAVDLIGRAVHDDRVGPRGPRRFEHVEGAEGVDFKIVARVGHRGGHRHLGGEVKDGLAPLGGALDCGCIADVAVDELKLRHMLLEPLQIGDAPAPRKVVEHRHLIAASGKVLGQVRPDEPGAAGDENFHIASSRCGVSLPLMRSAVMSTASSPLFL